MSPGEPTVTSASVRAAAGLAGLLLEEDRADAVAEVLSGWLPGVHALNARVAELGGLTPTTPFTFVDVRGADDERRSAA